MNEILFFIYLADLSEKMSVLLAVSSTLFFCLYFSYLCSPTSAVKTK